MEHVFKLRSSEFIEDETWTKSCLNELKKGTADNSLVVIDPQSKRDVCFFELDGGLNLYNILRKNQNGKLTFSGECLTGTFMYTWILLVKDISSAVGNGTQIGFDQLITVYSKVSSATGDIRTVRQKCHGAVTLDSAQSVVELKSAQRQSDIAIALGFKLYDDVVDLLFESNFVYLCQRNNFKLSLDQFAEVEPFVDPLVYLKRVDKGLVSAEKSNNIEVELLRLLEEPIFRLLLDHLAEHYEIDAVIEEKVDEFDDVPTVLISWSLLHSLVQFTRDAYEKRKSIIEDVKKKKLVLAIYRYFHETDSKSFSSTATSNSPVVFRFKVDRCEEQ